MTVKVTINKNWLGDTLEGINAGQLEMVTDIHRRSKILAPFDTGALVNSAIIRKVGQFVYTITFGNPRVPYARRQFFENKTKSHYLTKAAEGVVRGDISRYFRGKV
jgi:hypothetical protein